jgi:hypothetical protein
MNDVEPKREIVVDPNPDQGELASTIVDLLMVKLGSNNKEKPAGLSKYTDDVAGNLGKLILKINPYTNKKNKDTQLSTGEMEFYQDETNQPAMVEGEAQSIYVGLEMEGPYRQEWTFKGHPQKVGMAARIKYRYPVRDEDEKTLFWVDDYILIGFQGSMGG